MLNKSGCILCGKLPKGDGGDWDKLLMLPRCGIPEGIPIGIEELFEKHPDVENPALSEELTELVSMSLSNSRSKLPISKSSRFTSSRALPIGKRYRHKLKK